MRWSLASYLIFSRVNCKIYHALFSSLPIVRTELLFYYLARVVVSDEVKWIYHFFSGEERVFHIIFSSHFVLRLDRKL